MQLRLFLKKLVSLFRKSSRLSQASDQARRECSDLFRSIITDETLAQALSSAVVNDNASLPYTESPADTLNELYSVRPRLLFSVPTLIMPSSLSRNAHCP